MRPPRRTNPRIVMSCRTDSNEAAMTSPAKFSAEPNITPMIDVLLVLLIVFMVAAVRMRHTMDVQLPQPCASSCVSSDAIVLEVLPGPRYRVNKQAVAGGELATRLRVVYQGRPDKTLQVAGGAHVRYDDIIAAMDIAKSAGVRVLSVLPKQAMER